MPGLYNTRLFYTYTDLGACVRERQKELQVHPSSFGFCTALELVSKSGIRDLLHMNGFDKITRVITDINQLSGNPDSIVKMTERYSSG